MRGPKGNEGCDTVFYQHIILQVVSAGDALTFANKMYRLSMPKHFINFNLPHIILKLFANNFKVMCRIKDCR